MRTLGAAPIRVKQGDMLLLPHGTGHVLSDQVDTPAVPVREIIERHFDRNTSVVDYGGGGAATRVVGGIHSKR